MIMRRFVEAIKKPSKVEYEGVDSAPGTDVVRTYVANGSLYSNENDIKKIVVGEIPSATAARSSEDNL